MEAVSSLADRVKLLQDSGNFRGVVVFKKLKQQQLRKLVMAMERVEYADGEPIVTIGEEGDALYVIESGECSVDVDGIAGDAMTAGTSFGELALITEDKQLLQRTATVTAVGDCVLLRMAAKKVRHILDSMWGGTFIHHMRPLSLPSPPPPPPPQTPPPPPPPPPSLLVPPLLLLLHAPIRSAATSPPAAGAQSDSHD
jgi:hypothetical protein